MVFQASEAGLDAKSDVSHPNKMNKKDQRVTIAYHVLLRKSSDHYSNLAKLICWISQKIPIEARVFCSVYSEHQQFIFKVLIENNYYGKFRENL